MCGFDLATWEAAVHEVEGFLAQLRLSLKQVVPHLFSPLSYQYNTTLVDEDNNVMYLEVVNDIFRWGDPWIPQPTGGVGEAWRGQVRGWGLDPDKTRVHTVQKVDIPEVMAARKKIAQATSLGDVMENLCADDLEMIAQTLHALLDASKALEGLPAVCREGSTFTEEMRDFVDDNWSSLASNDYEDQVMDLSHSLHDLGDAIELLVNANESSSEALMSFVMALVELVGLRKDQATEVLSGFIATAWLSPDDWVAWSIFVLDVMEKGSIDDVEERRSKLQEMKNGRYTLDALRAEEASFVTWPTFGYYDDDLQDSPGAGVGVGRHS